MSDDEMRLSCPYCEIPLRAEAEGVSVQQDQRVLFVGMSCTNCNTKVNLVVGVTQPICLSFDNEVLVLPGRKAASP